MKLTEAILVAYDQIHQKRALKHIATCYCGREYTRPVFMHLEATNGVEGPISGLYWRNCECGNTIAMEEK